MEKYSIHFCADGDTIETVFRTIISVSQLSIYGAVSDLCDEYRTCQARTGRPVPAGQPDPLFEPAKLLIMTPTPTIEILAQENLLQKYKERVERLPQQDQLTRNVGFEGIPKLETVLELTTSYLQGKYGVKIRTESVNKDNSHSWVRNSHGLNKLVTDLSNKEYDDNEQETSEMKSEEFALKTNVLASASRSKAKAKPRRRSSACLQELYLSVKGLGLMWSQQLIRISLTQCQND